MSPDIEPIIAFHAALFKHASSDTCIAARAFRDDSTQAPPFLIQACPTPEAPRAVYGMAEKATHPYKITGNSGLFLGRATLAEPLSDLTRKDLARIIHEAPG